MATATASDVYYDPYDVGINADPYPTYARLRDEAPAYHNERYDFWALSRHADVETALVNWKVFSNTRSDILDIIKAGVELPPGVILFEDPPVHTMHRGLMSRVFTPRRMAALEDQVRAFCARSLDPLVGSGGFDIIEGLAWRAEHPSDDLMTHLLNAEFEDESGQVRTLTRQEVLTYTSVIAGAGNETTGRLIGWLAKLLAEHPDQRREVVEDRSLIPQVIDEALRFEPTGHATARYVMEDVDYHGTTIPAGSPILLLLASANRDPRRYTDPDVFDIHRDDIQHLTFGYGLHFCLGANLARLEGRVALDELLKRFPEWEVDYDDIKLAPTSTVRGWERMPIVLPTR
jgi:cytochrome P450